MNKKIISLLIIVVITRDRFSYMQTQIIYNNDINPNMHREYVYSLIPFINLVV